MTATDRGEPLLIALATGGVFLAAPWLPPSLSIGRIILIAAAALLFQSLLRDLWILARARRSGAGSGKQRKARCMCIESTVGMIGVVVGGLLIFSGLGAAMPMPAWAWAVGAATVLTSGYLVKDWVLTWKPWGLVRDPDHLNIIVTWK